MFRVRNPQNYKNTGIEDPTNILEDISFSSKLSTLAIDAKVIIWKYFFFDSIER